MNFSISTTLSGEATTFLDLKSYSSTTSGGLVSPFKNIVEFVIALEDIFINKFGELMVCRENIGKPFKSHFANLYFILPCKNFLVNYLINLYTRVRIYYPLKFAKQIITTSRANKSNVKLTILQYL